MAEAKTKPTAASVDAYIESRASDTQRADCARLMTLLHKVTKETPRMWGPSIVGYGSYRYPLAGGKTGESCATGFAIRGKELVVYLVGTAPDQDALLERLGPYRMGKACLYL
nr:DUF1801 domain-containing protein [Gemmatimonadaceae bacterium]